MTADPAQIGNGLEEPTVALDSHGRINEDVGCRRCGYGLRGQSPGGICPECGTAVQVSIKGDLLRYSDPDWLRHIVRGIDYVMIALTSGLATLFVAMSFSIVSQLIGAPVLYSITIAGTGILAFLISVLSVYGTWLLTTPDPSQTVRSEGVTFRALARWLIFAALLAGPSNMYMSPGGGITAGSMLAASVLLAGIGAGIVQAFAQAFKLLYVRQLAARIPTQRFRRRALVVAIGNLVSSTFLMICTSLLLLVPGMAPPAPPAGAPSSGLAMVVSLGACFGVALYVFFLVAYLLVLLGYRRLFKAVDRAAQQAAVASDANS